MHWKPLPEEAALYVLVIGFLIFAVTSLVGGFATNRHKNHRIRLRAKARRRAAHE